MIRSVIAAMSRNNVIGCHGSIPWYSPRDLRFFKQRTMGHHVLVGRRTYNSLCSSCKNDPLPGRSLVVLTSDPHFSSPFARSVRSFDEAFDCDDSEFFIAGGEQVYRNAFAADVVDKIYLTTILKDFDGDAFFPSEDLSRFRCLTQNFYGIDSHNADRLVVSEFARID